MKEQKEESTQNTQPFCTQVSKVNDKECVTCKKLFNHPIRYRCEKCIIKYSKINSYLKTREARNNKKLRIIKEERIKAKKEEEKDLIDAYRNNKNIIDKVISNTDVGSRFAKCSFDNYEGYVRLITDLLIDFKDGLYLWGGCGCGKTHLAVAALRFLIQSKQVTINKYIKGLGSKWLEAELMCDYPIKTFELLSIPILLFKLRQTFSKDNSDDFMVIADRIASNDLLILDDLGAEKWSEWTEEVLYYIINSRYENEKFTVFTSNLNLDGIKRRAGDRIASRILGMTTSVEITGKNYRKG